MQLFEAFLLGNAAILTNVCLLPLYPGLIAFLGAQARDERGRRATPFLGVLVLAGILSLMTLIGLTLYLLRQPFGAVLPVLLPAVYGLVLLLGVAMLAGRNPFAGLARAQAPVLGNPYLTAFLYGALLAPMTLPCTGPLIVSAFVLGAGSAGALADGLLYFLAFGLGFGWPLALLPLVAQAAQRNLTRWLARNHGLLARASGALLVGIALFGVWTEVLPQVAAWPLNAS